VGNVPVLSPQEVIRLLEAFGFVEVRQRGSHEHLPQGTSFEEAVARSAPSRRC